MRLIILSISIYLLALTGLAHASTCGNNIVEFGEECDPIDGDTDLLELNTFCNSYCEIEDIGECLVNESTSVFDYNSDGNVDISSDLSFILDLGQALGYNNVDAIPTCENVQDTLCCPIGRVCDSNCDGMLTIQDYSIIAQNAQGILTTTTMCNVGAENYCATYYPTEPTGAPYDVSQDPCFLTKIDYNNDGVVDRIDWKRVDEYVWRGEESCPDGKICSFEYYGQCNEDYQLADSINLGYFILGHISLEDFKAQIGQCHEVECTANTCADYDAFDYNDDGRVDRDDARYLHSGWRIGHESCDTGTRYDSDRAERQMCCPAGKICDIWCADNGVSYDQITYPDYLIFATSFRTGDMPDALCESNGIEICEESQFETEYIRWFGVRYFLQGEGYTPSQVVDQVRSTKPSYITKSTIQRK